MFKRVRFFSGQILTAKDFEAEQEYHRGKRQLLNRSLFGSGIVTGLNVSSENGTVVISPGLALDPLGNEIVVDCSVAVDTSTCLEQMCFLLLRYAETESDPVPVGGGQPEFSRIEEGFALELQSEREGPVVAVCLGRLIRQEGGWVVDGSYAREEVRDVQDRSTPPTLT
jgi:hypothetical protein